MWDIQCDCIYQNDKEKNNSLCLFVPGDATDVPDWEIQALTCRISAESGGKMIENEGGEATENDRR